MLIFARNIVFVLLCMSPLWVAAADFPPRGFKEVKAEKSPQDSFKIVQYQRDPANPFSDSQIWLQALKPDFKTQLLFSHNNSATWLVSLDENFIAINYHVMSGLGVLQVFSRGKDGLYREVENDFLEVAHQHMASQLGLKAKAKLDHEACFADLWLREGMFLGHLVGNNSGVSELRPWYFIYDIKHRRWSWDLSGINQGAFDVYRRE